MNSPLRIAVASGKGGTGKTTVAASLAAVLAEQGIDAAYVDCDVEEPNGHILLKPGIRETVQVTQPAPQIDASRCTLCGACSRVCRFSAIVTLPTGVLTFPNLCHGCGGCVRACTRKAIQEVQRTVGAVEMGMAGPLKFLHGRLDVGEAMAPPVIRAVLEAAPKDCTLILDAPPGTSCPVVESVKTADVVLLVTESTPFGLSDLKQTVAMVRELGVPFAVVVNRAGLGDGRTVDYCRSHEIPVLAEIRNDLEIARAYSRGVLAVTALPQLKPLIFSLYERLRDLAISKTAIPKNVRSHAPVGSTTQDYFESGTLQLGRKTELPDVTVISGKGGTGKTSVVASFFALAQEAAVADCDVDAADLHLVLDPKVRSAWLFSGGKRAFIDSEQCTRCGLCSEVCRFGAIRAAREGSSTVPEVDTASCEGCAVCVHSCSNQAISLNAPADGVWFVSDTKYGPLVHARLGVAQENSGKLVSLVRREARAVSIGQKRGLLICDGSPGIGCPVIASIAGARLALVVTEPTLSGLHDLERVIALCRQLDVKCAICINKADVNLELSEQIEQVATIRSVPVLGRIRYDDAVTVAQLEGKSVVENGSSRAADDIRSIWLRVVHLIAPESQTIPAAV
jgi:MinD superfamily P-loop ATPase